MAPRTSSTTPPGRPSSDAAARRDGGRRASALRVKSFSTSETVDVMTAAADHSAEYRGRRTSDKKRRMEAVLLKVFHEATPSADKEVCVSGRSRV